MCHNELGMRHNNLSQTGPLSNRYTHQTSNVMHNWPLVQNKSSLSAISVRFNINKHVQHYKFLLGDAINVQIYRNI